MRLYISLNKVINDKIRKAGDKINIGKTGKISKAVFDEIKSKHADLWSNTEKNYESLFKKAKDILERDWTKHHKFYKA